VIAQKGALAALAVKDEWMDEVQTLQRANQKAVFDAVARLPGLKIAVYPSQGNFLVIECVDAGVKPDALVEAFGEIGIMIRQGSYHTPRFGDRFVKVSISVPAPWVDAFCEALPDALEKARGAGDRARSLF
jgi:histidinol-phosphate/aromatic aminotransferase/cobyric acid decarboxylase-like protein